MHLFKHNQLYLSALAYGTCTQLMHVIGEKYRVTKKKHWFDSDNYCVQVEALQHAVGRGDLDMFDAILKICVWRGRENEKWKKMIRQGQHVPRTMEMVWRLERLGIHYEYSNSNLSKVASMADFEVYLDATKDMAPESHFYIIWALVRENAHEKIKKFHEHGFLDIFCPGGFPDTRKTRKALFVGPQKELDLISEDLAFFEGPLDVMMLFGAVFLDVKRLHLPCRVNYIKCFQHNVGNVAVRQELMGKPQEYVGDILADVLMYMESELLIPVSPDQWVEKACQHLRNGKEPRFGNGTISASIELYEHRLPFLTGAQYLELCVNSISYQSFHNEGNITWLKRKCSTIVIPHTFWCTKTLRNMHVKKEDNAIGLHLIRQYLDKDQYAMDNYRQLDNHHLCLFPCEHRPQTKFVPLLRVLQRISEQGTFEHAHWLFYAIATHHKSGMFLNPPAEDVHHKSGMFLNPPAEDVALDWCATSCNRSCLENVFIDE